MKILHVLLSPRAEGTPRLVLDWLTVTGHQQELLFLSDSGELRKDFEKFEVWQKYNNAFVLKFTNGNKVIDLVKKVCLERKPDLVISWSMGFSHWVHIGARRAGHARLITHAGNAPGKTFVGKYAFTYFTCWIGSMVGAKVICCSDYIKNEYLKIPLLRSRDFFSVYNCFRIEKFQNVDAVRDAKQAIMVATLEEHKDHRTLLKAWKIIETSGYSYKLLLVGSGSLDAELRKLKDDLQLTTVQFLGSRSDVPSLLNQSNLFVFSTTPQEGFGTVLLEAMAAGCSIIASRVPACVEILADGRYGTLVSPADPNELANALLKAFADNQSSVSKQETEAYLSGFSPEIMMKRYLSISFDGGK